MKDMQISSEKNTLDVHYNCKSEMKISVKPNESIVFDVKGWIQVVGHFQETLHIHSPQLLNEFFPVFIFFCSGNRFQ